MSPLEKSMQAMALSDSMRSHTPSNRARAPALGAGAAIPDQIAPHLPPLTPESKDHRIFYGFEVSIPWLIAFCEKHSNIVKSYDPSWYSASKVHLALTLLRILSGIRDLRAEHVWCKVDQPHIRLGDKGYTPLVAVCSSMKSSWDKRPTNEQLERLQSLMGKEPDWFVDVNPLSFYRND